MSKKMIYLGGDMLKKGSQLLREMEGNELKALGYDVYSPKDDKEINDKQNQTEESNNGLAEKIVYKDTKGIIESDIIVIEPHENALGTMVELGQIKGMRDMAKIFIEKLQGDDLVQRVNEYLLFCEKVLAKPVYPHCQDVRRTNIPECGDRRSWGINQYVYGVCLDVTGGKGLYEWEEIVEELSNE